MFDFKISYQEKTNMIEISKKLLLSLGAARNLRSSCTTTHLISDSGSIYHYIYRMKTNFENRLGDTFL